MSNPDVTVYGQDRVAVVSADRAAALGSDANIVLDVVNEAQSIGLPVNGAKVFDERYAESLGMDRMAEIQAETGGGLFLYLEFYREPEPGDEFDQVDEDLGEPETPEGDGDSTGGVDADGTEV